MSEQTTDAPKRERKAGDLNVFISNKRETDKQPVLWGKVVIDPKALLEELAKNPTPDGFVELRVSLWGATSKNGAQYWFGNVKVNDMVRPTNNALPPGGETIMNGTGTDISTMGVTDSDIQRGPGEGDLPF